MSGALMIDKLRQRLSDMENERKFNGRSYPEGIEPFPAILNGQGFFPGGDGLWHKKDKLKEQSSVVFPLNGIMFLGNDFGSLAGFKKLNQHENPPTWWRLRQRLDLADIPGEKGFYTNAYLGLRSDRSALARPIVGMQYEDFCADFLSYQISVQEPSLIITLGDRPAALLQKIVLYPDITQGLIQYGSYNGKGICVLIMSHPYSDMAKTIAAKELEANIMRRAWLNASKHAQ